MEYKIHYKSIQKLSKSHDDLYYETCLHQTPTSDRQLTKEAIRSWLPRTFTTVPSNLRWWAVCWWIPNRPYTTLEIVSQCPSLGVTNRSKANSSLTIQAPTRAQRSFGFLKKKTEGSTSQIPSKNTRMSLPKSRIKLTVIATYGWALAVKAHEGRHGR